MLEPLEVEHVEEIFKPQEEQVPRRCIDKAHSLWHWTMKTMYEGNLILRS
jgi:hypothetical protein